MFILRDQETDEVTAKVTTGANVRNWTCSILSPQLKEEQENVLSVKAPVRVPCVETTELRPLLGRAFHQWGAAGTGCPLSVVSTEARLGDELSPAFKLGHSSTEGKKALMLRMSYRSYFYILKKGLCLMRVLSSVLLGLL